MTISAEEPFEDTGVKEEVTAICNNGGIENRTKSEDENDVVDPDEDVNELLRKAASSYEYRVKYYEELIHETVTEFERGIKRAHVDELSILINEATDETRQMQSVCHTIMRSLGKLIPIIYQSIEILEYQVKADTEHLYSLENGDDVPNTEETVLEDHLCKKQLNDQELKEKLGQVKLLASIDKIENRLIKGPVPPKVQNAITKARKLGNSLVRFLEQSKNIRAMFKETQAEVDHTVMINYLAQASARTTERSQNLASYYAKQTIDEVREVNVQTSRQVTRLKTELMERTKTNLLPTQPFNAESSETAKEKEDEVGGIDTQKNESNVEESLKVEERKATAKVTKKDKREKGGLGAGKEAKKPPGKSQGGKKLPEKKGKIEPKEKEPPQVVEDDFERDENENDEKRDEEERLRQSAIEEFSTSISSKLDEHSKLSRRLAEIHARVRQIKEEIQAADKVFIKFPTKDRQNLEDLLYHSMDDVLSSCKSAFLKHTTCSINLGTLMDAIEESHESKQLIDNHQELKEVVQTAHDEALISIAEIGELVAETEEYYEYFMLVKCIWEVEVPTSIVFEARKKVSNLRDLTYRVQFNRKELLKVSATLLREVDLHEWNQLMEIQVLGGPAKEVERVVASIDKHTYSNESLVLKALADIDRLNRSTGLQKVEPLENIQNFLPEVEYRYTQTRTLLNNIHRLMVECKHNVVKLMEDPSKKWKLIKLPINDNLSGTGGYQGAGRTIAILRAPEECVPLLTSRFDVSMKHAWEKNAVRANELLVSEIVYFPSPLELPCNILLGLQHGVISVDNSYERLKLKQTLDGVSWTDCETYKDHLFYAYPDHKDLIPPSVVFAELKTDELALAYCVVLEYTDGRNWARSGPIVFTDSKKVFREGGKIAATRDKYSHVIVPKDSFAFLSSVTVKSIRAGEVFENEMKQKFGGLSALSALYTIYVGAPTVSPFTRFTLQIPFPQEVFDVRRPSTARITVLAFEKNVQQWVLLTNSGRDDDVVSVRGGLCSINVNPNNIQKVMVVNGQCENVYMIPEHLEMLVAKLPRKPYSDDDVLDEHCLRQIVDRLLLEFDRFAIVLGISNQFRNKAKVSRKTNVSQQKFEILKEWRRKNVDSGDLVPRMLKALRSEIVSRYDIADWLEEVLSKERQSFQINKEKYQHVQAATHRRDYLFSPATVVTDEAPFALGKVLEEPAVTSRADSRGLSDISSERDNDEIQIEAEDEHILPPEVNVGENIEVLKNEQPKEIEVQLDMENDENEKEQKPIGLSRGIYAKQKTELEFSKRDINPGVLYRNKTLDNLKI